MSSIKIKNEELITFIKEIFSIQITDDELKNPTKEFVIFIYSRFLAEFGFDDLYKPDLNAISGIQNIGQPFEPIIFTTNVFKCVSSLVTSAGIPDMSISDVLIPKSKRTKRILTTLCKLLINLYNIQHKWSELEQRHKDRPQKRVIVENAIKNIKKSIEEKSVCLSVKKKSDENQVQVLKKLAQNYEYKKTTAEALKERAVGLKRDVLQKRENLSEIKVEINKTKEEIEIIEKQIVKSPERIKAMVKCAENELKVKRKTKKSLEKQNMKLFRSLNTSIEGSKLLNNLLKQVMEALVETQNLRNECEVLHSTEDNLSNKVKKVQELKIQLREHKNSIKNLKNKFANDQKQYVNQIKTMKEINNGIKNEINIKIDKDIEEQKILINMKIEFENKLNGLENEHKMFKEKSQKYYSQHLAGIEKIEYLLNKRLDEYKKLL